LEYSRGTETILLVEDEEPLRKVVVELLTQIGYNVLSASNAKEAMHVAATCPGKIHLLITDVLMPEIDGPELAKTLCAARPDLKVILCSGYDEQDVSLKFGAARPSGFLRKPYSPAELLQALRSAWAMASSFR